MLSSGRRGWLVLGGVAVVVILLVVGGLWVWSRQSWRDDSTAGARDVRLQCRTGHDDPYLAHVTVTNHSGHQLDYRIDGENDEITTSTDPKHDTYPFHTEVDGLPDGASWTVNVAGPGPSGYVIGGQCRLLRTQTRDPLF